MKISAFLACTFALVLQGCLSTDQTSPNSQGDQWDTTFTLTTLSKTTGRILVPSPSAEEYRCISMVDSTGRQIGSVLDTQKTVPLDLRYDGVNADTLWAVSDSLEFDLSGRKISFARAYSRISGTGPVGIWEESSRERFSPIGFSDSDSAYQAFVALNDKFELASLAAGYRVQIEIGSTSLICRIRYPNWSAIEAFNWQENWSPRFDVQFRVIDAKTATFTAADTQVTVQSLGWSHTRYSSNFPAAYPTYIDPTTVGSVSECPESSWFWDFLSHHLKTSSAARALSAPGATSRRSIPSGFWMDPFGRPF